MYIYMHHILAFIERNNHFIIYQNTTPHIIVFTLILIIYMLTYIYIYILS